MSDEFDDPETVTDNREILSKIPFAVVGSEKYVDRADGTSVRGRRYPWGIIEVENEEHNDFIKLRQMLLRTHMEELKDTTDMVLYENYRTQKLLSMGHVQDNNVFREFNPLVQLEEERRSHEGKMQKMEAEMTAVFQQKVQEKESKLKQSEEELYARHKEMKTVLEKQRSDLDDKKKRAEASARPITPMEHHSAPTAKSKKKNIFSGRTYARPLWQHGYKVSEESMSKAFSRAFKEIHQVYPNYGHSAQMTSRQWWATVIDTTWRHAGINAEPTDALVAARNALIDRFNTAQGYRMFDEVPRVLGYLRRKGLKMGVISNMDEGADSVLRGLGVREYFDFVLKSVVVGVEKPDPKMFEMAMSAVNVQAYDALHVGDSEKNDYVAARNAGMQALLINRGPTATSLASQNLSA
ncbi:Cell division control protein 3 [Coemansia sp. RSA 1933]|nr:Cell division control protein 3 [Coemansia sp. RSA 1933]